MTLAAPHPVRPPRNHRTGIIMGAVALAMLGVGYAAVPLYRAFCQATGFGGTPLRASEAYAAQVKVLTGHTVSVRFDANVESGFHWGFAPEANTKTVTLGARNLAFFDAVNNTDQPVTGRASYNISPESAAPFFVKIQCFCFTQQTLAPHQKVRMPVVFYVDPAIAKDANNADTHQITLSYTFHPLRGAAPASE